MAQGGQSHSVKSSASTVLGLLALVPPLSDFIVGSGALSSPGNAFIGERSEFWSWFLMDTVPMAERRRITATGITENRERLVPNVIFITLWKISTDLEDLYKQVQVFKD
jgi:hypothetical protein